MTEIEQKKDNDTNEVSPLAQDKTYGERVHHYIFDIGINFVANLLLSAGFSYWVNHSQKPIKLFGTQFNRPSEIQTTVAKWIERKPFMGVFKGNARTETAKVMSGVLTLTAAGHAIMIPSVWLGGKFKSPIVESLNRSHYGEEAMQDEDLQARHYAVATEARPTLFGAIIGRFGTICATQFTAYTIGSQTNLVKWGSGKIGFKAGQNFKGIDHATEFAGEKFGSIISETLPKQTAKLNAAMAKRNYGWSDRQKLEMPGLANKPYGTLPSGATQGFNEHFGKYVVSDILYTIVTAVSISPAINFFKKFIPGVTYKPEAPAHLKPAAALHLPAKPAADLPVSNTLAADEAEASEAPTHRIMKPQHHATIAAAQPTLEHEGGRA